MIYYTLPAVVLGFILDLIVGDPHWLYHPVRMIGKLIDGFEYLLRAIFPKSKRGERAAGGLLVILVAGISTAVPAVILYLLYHKVNVWAGFILEAFWCYQLLATKALKVESMRVHKALTEGTLPEARTAVSMIVGRDTAKLDVEGVTKAAVETVAENTADGIIAPLVFLMLGGAAAGFFYKSINTMDSMVGYKNEKYRYFGTAAAKTDDVVNFLPSRIAAWLMIAASFLIALNGKQAGKIYRRDRLNHSSPNSAQTESVMAGALGVQLAGNASYFGRTVEKPSIGDPLRPVVPRDIVRANQLMYVTASLALILCGVLRWILLLL
ncbi:adenosylcobinamide-phosphate synthase CbiB [Novisyntrophococcus fermenticellae]|uniref:adenosylcobinamide-phosphate synthase CbiB n=1 Tax=Novisyntrophococcus fermenticellae TaxID=2068655 RepID=UPI001E367764|nr:adenosylcobinamide-phosphate synthase CbiB [Novisyntrophococcus fermenticellae]